MKTSHSWVAKITLETIRSIQKPLEALIRVSPPVNGIEW